MAFSKYTPARPGRAFVAQLLETRMVFSAYVPTTYEQYMLELINRARANPAAEAARLGIDLNEGVTGSSITTTPKQPLSMNGQLVYAIRNQLVWLQVNSQFGHGGQGGSTPQSRIADAGYSLSGNAGSTESLGITLGATLGDLAARTRTLYENLFLNAGVTGRGDRVNLLDATMDEVGTGLATGDYSYQNKTYTGILAGADFAYHAGNPFLTGVVYEDKIAPDSFYSPGEGLDGYTITAKNAAGTIYSTTSSVTGGYSLQLPAGTYQIVASKPATALVVKYADVVISTENVKRDFEAAQFAVDTTPPPPPIATLVNGTLTVNGTIKDDNISVLTLRSGVAVQVNEQVLRFATSDVLRILVDAGAGNDYVLIGEDQPTATITGGVGDDTLIGTANADSIEGGDGDDIIKAGGGDDIVNCGAGDDQVIGEGGRDTIHGDDGNDRLDGGGGNDALYGDTNDDRLYGGAGNDRLEGGGNVDKIYGEDGNDALIGGGSNDRLYGGAGDDVFWGNKGNDYIDGNEGINVVRDRDAGDTILNAVLA